MPARAGVSFVDILMVLGATFREFGFTMRAWQPIFPQESARAWEAANLRPRNSTLANLQQPGQEDALRADRVA